MNKLIDMPLAVTTPLAITGYDRLWWIAVAAVNQGLETGAQTVLDALEQTPSHMAPARAVKAFAHWRLDRSPRAVAKLEDLAPGCEVARCFHALIQLESGLVEAALAAVSALMSSPDEKARQLARAVLAKAAAELHHRS